MPVISIISDSLPSDPYLSLLQYKIKKAIPDAEIILWAYGVQPFNLNQALILVESSINQLPEGSIHLVDITADEEKEQRFACGKIFHQWVVGRFSKIFGLLSHDEWEGIWKLHSNHHTGYIDNLLTIISDITEQIVPDQKYIELDDNERNIKYRLKPYYTEVNDNTGYFKAQVIYIDHYGNAYINVNKSWFEQNIGDRFLYFQFKVYKINEIHHDYTQVETNQLLLMFNSLGYCQLSIRNQNAARLLGIKPGDQVLFYVRKKDSL